jgi:hypothetical protein
MTDMTDDDPTFDALASAYLDDEVTPLERSSVEGDAALLARVAELRAVRAALQADVGQGDETLAAAHVAAALVEFDRVAAGGAINGTDEDVAGERTHQAAAAAAVTPADDLVVARARRARVASRRWKPVLAIAGAAALGVGALSTLDTRQSARDATSSAADTETTGLAAATTAEAGGDEVAAAEAAPADGGGSGADSTTRQTIGEIGVADVAEAPAAVPGAETTAAAAAEEALTTKAAGDAPALTTEEQLAAYATTADEQYRNSNSPNPPPDAQCADLGRLLGPVTWQGTPGELYVESPESDARRGAATVATPDCVPIVSVTYP